MKLRTAVPALVALAATLGVVFGYWYLRAPESTQVKVGQIAPDLKLPFVGGTVPLSLSRRVWTGRYAFVIRAD